VIAVLLLAVSLTPVEIIQAAVELSEKTDHLRRNYAVTQENIQRSGDKTTTKIYELTFEKGVPHRRLIRRDGKPVNEKPETYGAASDERRIELLREMPKAFDYTFGPEEQVDGYDCWLLIAKPKKGYKPSSIRTSFLVQMEAKVWIAKKYHRLVRLDAVTVGPVSFGWFLAKVEPGTRVYLEQARIEDDVWLPKRFKMSYDARVLFRSVKGEFEQVQSDFRRISPST
jgi:hypothetical protein